MCGFILVMDQTSKQWIELVPELIEIIIIAKCVSVVILYIICTYMHYMHTCMY